MPFSGQDVTVDLDLLLCTGFDSEHAALFLCLIFTHKPMYDCKIERSNEQWLRGFGLYYSAANSGEIHRNSIAHER